MRWSDDVCHMAERYFSFWPRINAMTLCGRVSVEGWTSQVDASQKAGQTSSTSLVLNQPLLRLDTEDFSKIQDQEHAGLTHHFDA